jgi:hypothetical protein
MPPGSPGAGRFLLHHQQFRQHTESAAGWTDLAGRTLDSGDGREEQPYRGKIFRRAEHQPGHLWAKGWSWDPAELHGSNLHLVDDLWITPPGWSITGLGALRGGPSSSLWSGWLLPTRSEGHKLWGQTYRRFLHKKPSDGKIDFTEVLHHSFGFMYSLEESFLRVLLDRRELRICLPVTRVSFESSESRTINGREVAGIMNVCLDNPNNYA